MSETAPVPKGDPLGIPPAPPTDIGLNARPVPDRLLALLDRLAAILRVRGDAIALVGLGSVGLERNRLDEHSDADFFVVVDPGRVSQYLGDIDWLEATAPIAWSFAHTHDGRKVLFADGLFAEYAVFTLDELRGISYHSARVVWARDDAPADLTESRAPLPTSPTVSHQVGEAVSNLFIGLHRDLRGEQLAATRFIQGHAVDRLITVLDLLGVAGWPARRQGRSLVQRDPYDVERRVEQRLTAEVLPLHALLPGYGPGRNASAALTLLDLLERHAQVDPTIAARIRSLATQAGKAAAT